MKSITKLSFGALPFAATLVASPCFADDVVVAPPAQQPAPVVVQQQPPAAQQPVAVGTTTTTGANYNGPAVVNSERSTSKTPNGPLLTTGIGAFGVTYVASIVGAAVSTRDAYKNLYMPVVGPWIDLSDRGCSTANPCGNNEGLSKAMIITSGVAQGAGALLIIGSFFIPESTKTETKTTTASWKLTPTFGSQNGVAAVGTF